MDRVASAPAFRVVELHLFERPLRFSKPLRIGATLAREGSQAFVRARVEVDGFGEAVGAAADLMAPCWYDQRTELDAAEKLGELRASLLLARDAVLACRSGTAFARHKAVAALQGQACAGRFWPRLAIDYGPAIIERAVLDALFRAVNVSFPQGMRRNLVGLDASSTPDVDPTSLTAFLASRTIASRLGIRHTVFPEDDLDAFARLLEQSRLRWFKLVLTGDPARDATRLADVARRLEAVPDAFVTLDGDERYPDMPALAALCDAVERDPRLAPISRGLLYIGQPFPRGVTLDMALGPIAKRHAFVIDGADEDWDAFPRARALGYRGVTFRPGKGLFRTVLNAARAQQWRAQGQACFVTCEDLASPAGLAVQQDSLFAAFLGAAHAERNGHRFVDGFTGAPVGEAETFLAAHPDLYERGDGAIRLRTREGALSLRGLDGPGFASAAMPAWDGLAQLGAPGSDAAGLLADAALRRGRRAPE